MKKVLVGTLAVMLLSTLASQAQTAAGGVDPVAEARETIQNWVKTRQLISQRGADWRVEKEILANRIKLYQDEVAMLNAQIEKDAKETSGAEERRAGLQAEADQLRAANREVERLVSDYEFRVRSLAEYFPPPLQRTVRPLLERMPRNPATTSIGAGERMAIVVTILNEVDKFNKTVTLDNERRELPSGVTAELTTMYVGLGQAYYVDGEGKFAGVGVPAKGGWQWTTRDDVAPSLLRAVNIYKGTIKPPVYVHLPVNLSNPVQE